MQTILYFDDQAATLATVGGKGANLAELTRAGFAVPPGFLVTTDAYRAFVAANGINDQVLALARGVAPDDPLALEHAAAEIRALFAAGRMPDDIGAAIDAAYAALAGADPARLPVAVRSSATAEDLPGLSFAGQQETYLNIIGPAAVRQAVQQCWASLWTARALGYRARNGIAPDEVALAVVVQQMIPAVASGVLFTANPLTGRRDERVIDAGFGLGEAVVSGQVEPDHYTVDGRTGRITGRKLGAKALTIVPAPGGGTTTLTHADANAQQQALPDAQILALARLAGQVAAHYGAPQDIEWAWDGGQLYLLQARPITSLYPLPALPSSPDDVRVYASVNSIQGVMDPITPLGRAFFHTVAAGLPFKRPPQALLPEAGGRLFVDITEPARDPRLRHIVLAALERADPGARASFVRLVGEGRIPTQRLLTPPKLVGQLFRARRLIGRALRAVHDPAAVRGRINRITTRYLSKIRREVGAAPDLAALLAMLEVNNRRLAGEVLAQLLPVILPGVVAISLVDGWLRRWLGTAPGAALQLLRGLPGNVTTEMDLKLWAAAQTIRANAAARATVLNTPVPALVAAYHEGTLPPTAQQALAGFLAEYGMRAVAEIDMGRPRWREDPSSIIQTLQSYLQLDDPNLAPDIVFRRGHAEAERLAADYVARVRHTRLGPIRARLLAAAIRRMRILGALRETPKFIVIKTMDIYRSAFLAQGADLVARGQLAEANDIFFVPIATLKRFAGGEPVDLRAVVAEQQARYQQELGRKQLPRLLLSTGEVFYEGLSEAGSNDLVGDPVSPGRVEGTVRIVLDPRGVRLEPGEILVCPATDPGWTPLFLAAGGLVMEIGGLVTHGSVVAREYGIPAVVGVHNATTRLQTGQRVRVDGSTGRVTVLSPPPQAGAGAEGAGVKDQGPGIRDQESAVRGQESEVGVEG
jgi:pyruvate,water dikinase